MFRAFYNPDTAFDCLLLGFTVKLIWSIQEASCTDAWATSTCLSQNKRLCFKPLLESKTETFRRKWKEKRKEKLTFFSVLDMMFLDSASVPAGGAIVPLRCYIRPGIIMKGRGLADHVTRPEPGNAVFDTRLDQNKPAVVSLGAENHLFPSSPGIILVSSWMVCRVWIAE